MNHKFYEKILILDGAYGTRFQSLGLTEADYRNKALKDHPVSLKGNHDLLNLTRPDVVEKIHARYIEAGAQIIKTNTFNSTSISQADYKLSPMAVQMALAGARIARKVADSAPNRVSVAGVLGPTNKALSLSPDVARPAYRAITYWTLEQAYCEQIAALDEGGVDMILIETIFDTLNAKAAIDAYGRFYKNKKDRKPLWLSATITDKSGRTLSGQTLEAFWISIEYANPAIVGINCALGAKAMLPYLRDLNRYATCPISCHPNAGLPNALGEYDETPEQMAEVIRTMAEEGIVNIVGSCCGSTPEHTAAIAKAVQGLAPRVVNYQRSAGRTFCLSGLEPLVLPRQNAPFLFIGERTNVAGSPKFREAARREDWEMALKIALEQVRGGANVLDLNFDDALLDGPALMRSFVNLIAGEPEIVRAPLMLDSSRLAVIEAGLQSAQGKCIVNSLSLKDGEQKFLENAQTVRRYGAAAIVMAFDERGQATDVARRVEICRRAYGLLTKNNFPACDIIFDPNVLTIGTGMDEHANYARDFIDSIPRIKAACPCARVSGGLSNLSFAFRGQDAIRGALHAVFLYHVMRAGLDMAIVNAGLLQPYETIPTRLRQLCEDLIFNRGVGSTEGLLDYAKTYAQDPVAQNISRKEELAWRSLSLEKRLAHALENGINDFVTADAHEALKVYHTPFEIIEGPLMEGMRRVGDLFGEGKMFLPQVVKTARVMKEFVAIIEPYLKQNAATAKKSGKILLATVKGDVHDIGKNIVGIVLACNNYEIVDLGAMVPFEKILEAIGEHKPDIIGFSGLITPSLFEMIYNARQLEKEGIRIPLLIGGATTSRLHTALKLDPEYGGAVVHVADASRVAEVCHKLLSDGSGAPIIQIKAEYAELRQSYARNSSSNLTPLVLARAQTPAVASVARISGTCGVRQLEPSLGALVNFIDWSPFFWVWNIHGVYPCIFSNPEAQKLFDDAQKILNEMIASKRVQPKGVIGFWPAWREGDSIVVSPENERSERFHFLRQQRHGGTNPAYQCLSDFISTRGKTTCGTDSLGGFVLTATDAIDILAREFSESGDDYSALIVKALGDRLVEAFAEYAHIQARRIWGQGSPVDDNLPELLEGKYPGIRPAIGYPCMPDHTEKAALWRLLDAGSATGTRLTENFAISPASTVCGLYFHHPGAKYFNIGKIGEDQLEDYAARKNWTIDEARKWLAGVL